MTEEEFHTRLKTMSPNELVYALINSVQEWELSKDTPYEMEAFDAIEPFEKELLRRLEFYKIYEKFIESQEEIPTKFEKLFQGHFKEILA